MLFLLVWRTRKGAVIKFVCHMPLSVYCFLIFPGDTNANSVRMPGSILTKVHIAVVRRSVEGIPGGGAHSTAIPHISQQQQSVCS